MDMTWDEYFHNLRLTTIEVTSPMIVLAVRRLDMLTELKDFIQGVHEEKDVKRAQTKILERYNNFVKEDERMLDAIKGKVDDQLRPEKKKS